MTIDATRVRDLMTPDPGTLMPSDFLSTASDVMRLGRIHHLPVIDEARRVVGMVNDRDVVGGALLRAAGIDAAMERRLIERIKVSEVMTESVNETTPDTSLRDAAALMHQKMVRCLPVVKEDGTLVGVLSERDFVVALVESTVEAASSAPTSLRKNSEPEWRGLEEEFDHLRAIRDELRVQLRLATMEARDIYGEAERRWAELERQLLRDRSDRSLKDAARIGRNFGKEISLIYQDLQKRLES